MRRADLLQCLSEHKPHVVHFSGHGSEKGEVFLLDNNGQAKPVSQKALVQLFRAIKDNIRLVFLNACFSHGQAEAIAQEIECTIGTTRAIGDDEAINFAAAFYGAIGFGYSVEQAFEQGKASLLIEELPEDALALVSQNPKTPRSLVLIEPEEGLDSSYTPRVGPKNKKRKSR
jgi:hypothetical protein